jgi:hypothetical protein
MNSIWIAPVVRLLDLLQSTIDPAWLHARGRGTPAVTIPAAIAEASVRDKNDHFIPFRRIPHPSKGGISSPQRPDRDQGIKSTKEEPIIPKASWRSPPPASSGVKSRKITPRGVTSRKIRQKKVWSSSRPISRGNFPALAGVFTPRVAVEIPPFPPVRTAAI